MNNEQLSDSTLNRRRQVKNQRFILPFFRKVFNRKFNPINLFERRIKVIKSTKLTKFSISSRNNKKGLSKNISGYKRIVGKVRGRLVMVDANGIAVDKFSNSILHNNPYKFH